MINFSEKRKDGITIDEISDDVGWQRVKNSLLTNVGTNGIPVIYVDDVEEGNVLVLRHDHDGRDIDLTHADEVVLHISHLWGDVVKLYTEVEGDLWEI